MLRDVNIAGNHFAGAGTGVGRSRTVCCRQMFLCFCHFHVAYLPARGATCDMQSGDHVVILHVSDASHCLHVEFSVYYGRVAFVFSLAA